MSDPEKTREKNKENGNPKKQTPERDPLVAVMVQMPASLRKRLRRASTEMDRYQRDLVIMGMDEYLEKLGF